MIETTVSQVLKETETQGNLGLEQNLCSDISANTRTLLLQCITHCLGSAVLTHCKVMLILKII